MIIPKWVVVDVKPKADYTLLLTFANGEKRVYNARPLLDKTIYAALKIPTFFLKAKVDGGTVIWNDEVDIAPEYLYEHSIPCAEYKTGAYAPVLCRFFPCPRYSGI